MNDTTYDESHVTGIPKLLGAIGVGVWEWTVDTGVFVTTPQCEQIMGYGENERPRLYAARVESIHPDDRKVVDGNLNAVREGRVLSGSHEFRVYHKSGAYVWVQERFAVSKRNADGKPAAIAGILHDVTPFKQAAITAEAERRHREYVAHLAGLGAWEWDVVNDHITFSNDYKALLGRDPEEMNGSFADLSKLMSEDDLEKLRTAYQDYFARHDDGVFSMKVRVNNASGDQIWVLNIASIVKRDTDGNPTLVRGGVLNIDKTVRTENLLRDALKTIEGYNERLKSDVISAKRTTAAMFDANPQVNILIDDEFRAIDCNPAAIEFFGFSGKDALLAEFRRHTADGVPTRTEKETHDIFFGDHLDQTIKNGYSTFPVRIPGKPEMNAIMKRIPYDNSFAVIIYVNEPSESEKRIQIMLDAAPIGCVMVDESFNLIDCNQAILRLTGLPSKEAFIKHVSELFPDIQPDGEPSSEKRTAMMEKASKTGHAVFNWTYVLKNGETIHTEMTIVRVVWNDSFRLVCFIHDLRDVMTEQENAREVEAYTQLMLDSTPMACSVWDVNGKIIDCNLETLRLLGLQRKSDYINRFDELNPIFQSDGRPSRQKSEAMIHKALETGYQRFEWEFRTDQGMPLPAEVMLVRVIWKKGYRILSYARDLREIKKANAAIERYTRVLRTVNEVAWNLIASTPDDFNQTVPNQLKHLGKVVGADRVSVWENYKTDNDIRCRQTYSWGDDTVTEKDVQRHEILRYNKVPSIRKQVFSGETINSLTRDLPPDTIREFVTDQSIHAVLIIPVKIEGHTWGFIRFDNCLNESVWPAVDKQALQYCGLMIASAITRNRMTGNLIETKNALMMHGNLLYAVNEAATCLFTNRDLNFMPVMQTCLKILGKSVGADRVSLWRNFEDEAGKLCSHRLSSWDVFPDAERQEMEDIIDFASYLPEWDKDVNDRKAINLPVRYQNEMIRNLSVSTHSKSLLLVHIDIDGSFWGFIVFAHAQEDHLFSPTEIDILRSGSALIVMGFVRNEFRRKLIMGASAAHPDIPEPEPGSGK